MDLKILPNEIVLRPRFHVELPRSGEDVLDTFEKVKREPFLIKRLDEHIFIRFNQDHHHFWSPQLHLEIERTDEKKCRLYGVFGPNPTLWTFFMFLHFGTALLFIVSSIWLYSSVSLHKPYGVPLSLVLAFVLLWFVLYALGRAGRHKGKPQMRELYGLLTDVLGS